PPACRSGCGGVGGRRAAGAWLGVEDVGRVSSFAPRRTTSLSPPPCAPPGGPAGGRTPGRPQCPWFHPPKRRLDPTWRLPALAPACALGRPLRGAGRARPSGARRTAVAAGAWDPPLGRPDRRGGARGPETGDGTQRGKHVIGPHGGGDLPYDQIKYGTGR